MNRSIRRARRQPARPAHPAHDGSRLLRLAVAGAGTNAAVAAALAGPPAGASAPWNRTVTR